MFVFVTIVCIAVGLIVPPAERQRKEVEAIRSLDGVTKELIPENVVPYCCKE